MSNNPRGKWTSASNALADSLCQGRHLAQRGLPDTETREATFGSQIHEALAKQDPAGLTVEQRDSYEACCKIEQKLVRDFFAGEEDVKVYRHRRLWAKWGELRHSGEADVLYVGRDKALIPDYKTLGGAVDPPELNEQLRDLAALAYINFQVIAVGTAIIQPLVTHSPTICLYEAAELQHAEFLMLARAAESNKPDAPRVGGEVQCKFCKAKRLCLAYQQWSGSMLPMPRDLFAGPMTRWTPEQRAVVAEALGPMRKQLEEMEQYLKDCLRSDPDSVPGSYLKPGRINRPITDPQTVFDRFIALGGKPEDFVACVDVGKKKLGEKLMALTGLTGVALDAALERLIQGCTTEKPCAPTLARRGPVTRLLVSVVPSLLVFAAVVSATIIEYPDVVALVVAALIVSVLILLHYFHNK